MTDKQTTYFQYFKDLGYPVLIQIDLADFEASVVEMFLKGMNISIIEEKDKDELIEQNPKNYKLLKISRANARAMKQIGRFADSDRFGAEKIIPKDGYNIYRHQGHGLMIYSHRAQVWEMATTKKFGHEENLMANRIMMTRFLAWALAPMGICGFWATSVDEGAVISRASETSAESIFIDIHNEKVLTFDGVRDFDAEFSLIRLDSGLSGRSKTMKSEELLSYLSVHTTYFAYDGLPIPTRQMIQTLAQETIGYVIPRSHFVPRGKQATA